MILTPVDLDRLDALLASPAYPPTDSSGLCLSCGRWTPTGHPDAHEHAEDCPADAGAKRAQRAIHSLHNIYPHLASALRSAWAELEKLRAILPPTARSRGIVGEGSWAVFAEKVVAERDALRSQLDAGIAACHFEMCGPEPLGRDATMRHDTARRILEVLRSIREDTGGNP